MLADGVAEFQAVLGIGERIFSRNNAPILHVAAAVCADIWTKIRAVS
jgi:hypothetical protein